jgi:hypothetical protein
MLNIYLSITLSAPGSGLPVLLTTGASGTPAALPAIPPSWWQRQDDKERYDGEPT